MNDQEKLSLAINTASMAHHGQLDKGGYPYILHPMHLMSQLLPDIQLATIAVLHDSIEDTRITLAYLKDVGMSGRILSALSLLTRKAGQSYEEYIEEIAESYDAIVVKLKDLEHNLDLSRLRSIGPRDLDRIKKYHSAFLKLTTARSILIEDWEGY